MAILGVKIIDTQQALEWLTRQANLARETNLIFLFFARTNNLFFEVQR
jgi:hypothetical protein